jgi:hypothetical protein
VGNVGRLEFYDVVLEKISLTDRVRNQEALNTVKEKSNILHTTK